MHAHKETTSGKQITKSRQIFSTIDPNSYRYRTYHFILAWLGGSSKGNMGYAEKVSPSPVDGQPVWVTGYNYSPGPCTDFADNGDWIGGLPTDITWLVYPNKNTWQHSGGGGPPSLKPFFETTKEAMSSESKLQISIFPRAAKINDDPRTGFLGASLLGDEFYTDAVKNAAGDAEYANCFESNPESKSHRKHWGFTVLADHKSAHHFIGVINE